MDYRTLGSSGCAVSNLCLGTMTFGNETDEAGSHEQLDTFVAAGGNFVDTANVYTRGVSEEIIGRWYANRPADVTDRVRDCRGHDDAVIVDGPDPHCSTLIGELVHQESEAAALERHFGLRPLRYRGQRSAEPVDRHQIRCL